METDDAPIRSPAGTLDAGQVEHLDGQLRGVTPWPVGSGYRAVATPDLAAAVRFLAQHGGAPALVARLRAALRAGEQAATP